MPKFSAFGLFCLSKFENNQTGKCSTFFPYVILYFSLKKRVKDYHSKKLVQTRVSNIMHGSLYSIHCANMCKNERYLKRNAATPTKYFLPNQLCISHTDVVVSRMN